MELLENDLKSIKVRISIDEFLTLYRSLNEVCKGIDLFEFQTRMGFFKEEVLKLMSEIEQIIKKNTG